MVNKRWLENSQMSHFVRFTAHSGRKSEGKDMAIASATIGTPIAVHYAEKQIELAKVSPEFAAMF
jgi:hypothetical protein